MDYTFKRLSHFMGKARLVELSLWIDLSITYEAGLEPECH